MRPVTTSPRSTPRFQNALRPIALQLEERAVPAATLQVIHNSPYAVAASVDVYVNDVLFLDNLNFREATAFVNVPSDVPLKIDITAATAPNNANPVFTTTTTFIDGKNYIAIATGDPAATVGATKFGLPVFDIGRLAAIDASKTDVFVFHGSPDAPPVDVIARGVGTLVDDLPFGSGTPDYLTVPPAKYTLDVTLSNGITPVGSFTADLSGAAGKSLVVLASGFAAPPTGTDPSLGLLAVFSDGTSALLPSAPLPTFLQVIHNSPYASARTVDIYVNGAKFLDDLDFRKATPFTNVPSDTPLTIEVVAGAAPNNAAPIFTTTVTLAAGKNFIVSAIGNPAESSGASAFKLAVTDIGRRIPDDTAKTAVLVFHGTPDAPPVDVKVRGAFTAADDLAFGSYLTSYTEVSPGVYTLDVTLADGITQVASFRLDSSTLGGKAAVISATGFVAPQAADDPRFGLLVTFADGSTTLLQSVAPLATQSIAVGGVVGGVSQVALTTFTGGSIFAVNPFPNSQIVGRTATADVNGDGVLDLIVGAGPGGGPQVLVYDGTTKAVLFSFFAFETSFTGGVFVAAGDFNQDGFADLVVTPDQGGGPRVRILSGKTPTQVIADFFGIEDPNFRGGARAAVGDLDGDGIPDLLIGAGFGGGPRVAGFRGAALATGNSSVKLFPDFFVFETTLRNGVFLAVGDLDGDGKADGIFGGGPGGGPRILALSGADLLQLRAIDSKQLANFFAGDSTTRDGVRVAVKDLDGDNLVDLVTAAALTDGSVRTYLGANLKAGTTNPNLTFSPFAADPLSGIFVG